VLDDAADGVLTGDGRAGLGDGAKACVGVGVTGWRAAGGVALMAGDGDEAPSHRAPGPAEHETVLETCVVAVVPAGAEPPPSR
jgi:hypothetical protein